MGGCSDLEHPLICFLIHLIVRHNMDCRPPMEKREMEPIIPTAAKINAIMQLVFAEELSSRALL